ncbi:enoyl-[acyl-carrier-protein] reductase FabK [Acetanaerobacterium elongatum]|uniref:Probable nitronate monooxygenase n=1 Tax=Acetanaerobacterium elongatum TaxID=258515 RepID=A0A1H0EK51_9FIRM|nr:enoyl-[acyl-carrier protein] reductase II [Acetanaerobacterium elongatum]
MIKTRLTELLGVQYPIIQGGMAWVADANLAAAVSNAGGLGLIAAANAPAEVVRNEIRKAKTMTDKPFGVNIMLMSPYAAEVAQVVADEGVKVVTTGAGNPGKYMEAWKAAGIIVIPVVPSAALAKRMERSGADAVVAEGCESGGHIGELTTMALLPQVCDAVSIPVIGAGGIADERGLAAALMLGASGVQIGTLFLACNECNIHENYKKLVLEAGDTDTAVTGRGLGHPARALKNKFTRRITELEKSGATAEELENALAGSLRKAAVEGDVEHGAFMCGQVAGMIHEIRPAKEIVESLMAKTEERIKSFGLAGGVLFE